jgi:hypothetical protein
MTFENEAALVPKLIPMLLVAGVNAQQSLILCLSSGRGPTCLP